ncbi:MAG TPA: hypothetical protein VLV54_19755 [Thermoanaerobaculia bacterium]|nr:hypothetical protein [Thermoanaerobaculia bacterium]
MKKLSIHLSLLCLLALLLVPFAGCKKDEEPAEETPAATSESTTTVETSSSTTTSMDSNGTTTSESTSGSTMTSDAATTPPAGK